MQGPSDRQEPAKFRITNPLLGPHFLEQMDHDGPLMLLIMVMVIQRWSLQGLIILGHLPKRTCNYVFWNLRFSLEMFLSVEKLRNPIPCDVKRSRCIGWLYVERDFARPG